MAELEDLRTQLSEIKLEHNELLKTNNNHAQRVLKLLDGEKEMQSRIQVLEQALDASKQHTEALSIQLTDHRELVKEKNNVIQVKVFM